MRKQAFCRALCAAAVFLLVLTVPTVGTAATNLALTATATASCEVPGLPATNINDGDPATFWLPTCGPGVDSWLQLSWGTPQTFRWLIIKQPDGYQDVQTFEVWATIDGTPTKLNTMYAEFGGNLVVEFPSVTATDVKIVFKEAVAGAWGGVDIGEVEVYSPPTEPDLALPVNGGTASVSGNAGWDAGANGLNDGLVVPNWAHGWVGPSGWWQIPSAQISWSSPVTFNQVTVRFGSYSGNDAYYNWGAQTYRLQTSNDDRNWTDLQVGGSIRLTNTQSWAGQFNETVKGAAILQVYLQAPITSKYLWVRPGSYNDHSVIIQEIEVYNRVNPGWAVIKGKVKDAVSGEGVAAQLQIVAPTWNPDWQDLYNINIDASGNYTLVVDPGEYNLEVRGPGYVTQTIYVTTLANSTTALDVSMPRGSWPDFPNATLNIASPTGILTDSGNGLFLDSWWGIQPTVTTAGPDNRACIKLTNPNTWWDNFGLVVSPNFFAGNCDNAWLTITYLDQPRSGGFWFHEPRFSDPPGDQSSSSIQFEGTGQWVTRVVPFNMTYLNRGAWPYDCYVSIAPGDTYISSMSLSFRKPANYGVYPLSIDLGRTVPVEDGLNQLFNTWDGSGGYPRSLYDLAPVTVADGTTAHYLAPGQLLALAADATRLSGIHSVWFTLEYFDEGTDAIGLGLEKTAIPSWREYAIYKMNTGMWKKWILFIQNWNFNHYYGNDIWIWANGAGAAIRKVSISETMPADAGDLKIGEVKAGLLDKYVTVGGKVVTYDYGLWTYWIEEPDRSAGIQVNPRTGSSVPPVGTLVGVYGTLKSFDWSGPVIDDAQFVSLGTTTPLQPLAMSNRSAVSATGLSASGLFIRTWGTVVDVSDTTGKFKIDDGSGSPINVDSWDRPWSQRTYVPGVDYVIVTGAVTGAVTPTAIPTVHTSEANIIKL